MHRTSIEHTTVPSLSIAHVYSFDTCTHSPTATPALTYPILRF
jgi:hypothetical protein